MCIRASGLPSKVRALEAHHGANLRQYVGDVRGLLTGDNGDIPAGTAPTRAEGPGAAPARAEGLGAAPTRADGHVTAPTRDDGPAARVAGTLLGQALGAERAL